MSRRAGAGGGAGGGIFNIGKSRAKMFNKDTDVRVGVKDVARVGEVKEKIVSFLKDPSRCEKLGVGYLVRSEDKQRVGACILYTKTVYRNGHWNFVSAERLMIA